MEPSYGEPYVRVSRFAARDAAGATIESWLAVEEGRVALPCAGESSRHQSATRWTDVTTMITDERQGN